MDEPEHLKSAGLKTTLPRIKVLEFFESAQDRHLTAEDIYLKLHEAGEEISLATVYRTLTQFEAAGLISRHNFGGGQAVFELARGPHHDHIVCIHCGRVDEFYDEIIEKRQHAMAQKLGFTLHDHTMTLYGECNDKDCPGQSDKS